MRFPMGLTKAGSDSRIRPKAGKLASWLAGWAIGLGGVVAAPAWAEAPNADRVVYLKRNVFTIPFQVQPSVQPSLAQLRLFVSEDRGATWKLLRTADPSESSFTFKSLSDGEYWFTIAQVDHEGVMNPENPASQPPGLKVVLDTQAPEVELTSAFRRDGEASIDWRVSDLQPKLDTLKLEVKSPGDLSWRELEAPKTISGSVPLTAKPGETHIVRLTVADECGNVAQTEVVVVGDSLVAPREMDTLASRPADGEGNGFAPPPPPAMPDSGPAESDAEAESDRYDTPYQPIHRAGGIPTAGAGDAVRSAVAHEEDEPTFDRSRPDLPASPKRTDRKVRPASAVETSTSGYTPVAIPRDAIASTRELGRGISAPRAASGDVLSEPNRPTRRIPIVNSTRFALNYELRGVGPAGVGKVELYFTQDNGANWALLGTDPDLKPPFDVQLPGEGTYGLKVVVTNPAGYGQSPPAAGEAPQIVVVVDTTPPRAELYEPIPDPEASTEALLLSWMAEDPHMAPGGVGLYFAENPEGPWYKIKTDLPSSGQYSWRMPRDIPYKVYLRLLAKDIAANSSVADTPEPVIVDLSVPEATATEVLATLPGDPGYRQ